MRGLLKESGTKAPFNCHLLMLQINIYSNPVFLGFFMVINSINRFCLRSISFSALATPSCKLLLFCFKPDSPGQILSLNQRPIHLASSTSPRSESRIQRKYSFIFMWSEPFCFAVRQQFLSHKSLPGELLLAEL